MAKIQISRSYRTYRWRDKNPVIDKVRTLVQDEGLFKNLTAVHEISGVSTSTLHNWFHGDTKNPQHGTVMAVVSSLGFEEQFVRTKTIDVDAERKAGKKWLADRAEENRVNGARRPSKRRTRAAS